MPLPQSYETKIHLKVPKWHHVSCLLTILLLVVGENYAMRDFCYDSKVTIVL